MGLNVCLDVKIDILCGMSNLIDESKFFVTDYNFSVFIPMCLGVRWRLISTIKDGLNSYGVGARLILSGVTIRLDVANGSEGATSQLFITYPWSMFSVDNPG
jgi:hypothetical protein